MFAKLILAICLLVGFNLPVMAAAPHARIAIHGAKWLALEDGAPQFGLAGWSVIPNILDPKIKNLMVVGPAWKHQRGWVELLGGQLFLPTEAKTLWNLRAAYNLTFLHCYGEVQYFPKQKTGLLTLWMDYPIKIKGVIWLKAGFEANRYINVGSDVSEWGPNLIVPISGNISLTAASLIQNTGSRYTRVYTTLVF